MSTYELNMVRRFDLACHLDGQPLQFMMKHKCGPPSSHTQMSRC